MRLLGEQLAERALHLIAKLLHAGHAQHTDGLRLFLHLELDLAVIKEPLTEKLAQLQVMLRRDVAHHISKQLQNFGVFLQLLAPRLIVHIRKVDFDLFAKREQIIGILIVAVKLVHIGNVR